MDSNYKTIIFKIITNKKKVGETLIISRERTEFFGIIGIIPIFAHEMN